MLLSSSERGEGGERKNSILILSQYLYLQSLLRHSPSVLWKNLNSKTAGETVFLKKKIII